MDIVIKNEHKYRIINSVNDEKRVVNFYKGMDLEYQRMVGIKEIDLSEALDKKSFYELKRSASNEVRAMISVSDMTTRIPCIFEEYYDEKAKKMYIVMQWINGEELTSKMKTASGVQFLQWMIDLCDILSLMERKNLFHKDIKPANIMIDKGNQLRLIDFNLSISKPNMTDGTANYKAPEMKSNIDTYFSKADMFSIGVILYEYYTKSVPMEGDDYALRIRRFGKSFGAAKEWTRFNEPKEKCAKLSDEMNNVIVKCMKYNPADRFNNYNDLKNALIKAKRSLRNGRQKDGV